MHRVTALKALMVDVDGVLITPRLRMAIVEPAQGGESVRVRDGESAEGLGGWRLVELRPRAAVFEGPGGRRELDLRVWAGGDGTGAAAPGTMPMQAPSGSTTGNEWCSARAIARRPEPMSPTARSVTTFPLMTSAAVVVASTSAR